MVIFDCPDLNNDLNSESAENIFKDLKNSVIKSISKGGTAFIVMDSMDQSIKDPRLSLILGNSWFSFDLLNPFILKNQIKYQPKNNNRKNI